ncbi:MAG: gamma-glutamyl-gamma-aminobutyrate hydrolase [Rhodospirillaceae bacterium]|nr:gamma-glutamyl-gamma-aminobutyrate hydrolase [Magnetovibrio sp.]MAY66193.1 gamma-glutamyl-gamma-aminobutyrate hydrolase [Rhodospirillaceae bacterium]
MTARPRIGVTVSNKGARLTWLAHWLAVLRAGGRPVRLSVGGRTEVSGLDGLVIGGGDDIGAALYGGEVGLDVRIDPARDRMEQQALDVALHADLPILGVCRGAQMINIHLGGSLHQDVYAAYSGLPRLRTPLARKRISVAGGSRLARLMGGGRIAVNSLHHQAVKRLGRGLKVSARDAHRVVQAVENPAADFLVGVQWHPEFLIFHRRHQALYRGLVRAARG